MLTLPVNNGHQNNGPHRAGLTTSCLPRAYPVNSPQAKARLLILALLADGQLKRKELAGLVSRRVWAQIGMTRDGFFEVFHEFCADLSEMPASQGSYHLRPDVLEVMLAEISDSEDKQTLLRLMFDVIRSDDDIAQSEAWLFWTAVDVWRVRYQHQAEARRPPVRAAYN